MPERLGFVDSVVIIAVVAVITLALRAAPFVIFGTGRKTPGFVTYLGGVLPPAIIAALVVYCLRDVDFTVSPFGIPGLVSVAAVAAVHAWKKNTLVSILGGTVLYMVLIRIM